MKKSWRNIALILFVTHVGTSFSQVEEGKLMPNIRFDFQVPNSFTNKAFRKSFTGIFETGLSFNLNFGSYNAGLFYSYSEFQIKGNKIPGLNSIQHWNSTGLRAGYDLYYNKHKIILTPSLYAGYNWIHYSYVICAATKPDSRANAINFQPSFSSNFVIGDGFGIGGVVGYNITNYTFDPNVICLNEHKSYLDKDKTRITMSFSFGFCVYYEIKKRVHEEDY